MIRIILVSLSLVCNIFLADSLSAYGYPGEKIIYSISPAGKAEYSDLGTVDLDGRKVNLSVFKTAVFGFRDTERIYSDQETLLPIRVERDVSWWFGHENLVEEYDQRAFKVTITKFKGKKRINEQVLSADGPIHNGVLVPFSLRKVYGIAAGWSFVFRLPQKYEATLNSVDEIKVAGKKYSAFHFTSVPDKFEIWISDDQDRIPLWIKGKGAFNYSLKMREYKKE